MKNKPQWIPMIGFLCLGFAGFSTLGISEFIARRSIDVQGRITDKSVWVDPSNEFRRAVTYTILRPNGHSQKYKAEGNDHSLSRDLNTGDEIVKKSGELNYYVNGSPVIDFPVRAYSIMLTITLTGFCLVGIIFLKMLVSRLRPKEPIIEIFWPDNPLFILYLLGEKIILFAVQYISFLVFFRYFIKTEYPYMNVLIIFIGIIDLLLVPITLFVLRIKIMCDCIDGPTIQIKRARIKKVNGEINGCEKRFSWKQHLLKPEYLSLREDDKEIMILKKAFQSNTYMRMMHLACIKN